MLEFNNLDIIQALDFTPELVLQNLNRFFHYGISWEDHFEEINIVEKAINATHTKLIEAIREGSTHVHKRNMVFTFRRLIERYKLAFIHHSNDYYSASLRNYCVVKFEKNKNLIDDIFKIITHEGFSHRDHNILLRPYFFDFQNLCYIPRWDRFKNLRRELEKKLIKVFMYVLNSNISNKIANDFSLRPKVIEQIFGVYKACKACGLYNLKSELKDDLCGNCHEKPKEEPIEKEAEIN